MNELDTQCINTLIVFSIYHSNIGVLNKKITCFNFVYNAVDENVEPPRPRPKPTTTTTMPTTVISMFSTDTLK
jgi:hypothetical protein